VPDIAEWSNGLHNKKSEYILMTNPADKVEQWDIEKLIPYARNSRTHSSEQVDQIAASIKEWGWTVPILVDEAGGIIAGHGRTMAAKKLGIKTVPVIIASDWSEAKKRAYVIADNKLALNAGWNDEMLKTELKELQELNFNLNLTGFNSDELEEIFKDDEEISDFDNPYTTKIQVPTYEPVGEKPSLEELYDDKKAKELVSQIRESNLSDKEKDFLIAAASRHIVFNYAKIANFYAHSSEESQELMENSALVIIDFNKAIENGFVKLTEELSDILGTDEDE
jgi:hypothetical protein